MLASKVVSYERSYYFQYMLKKKLCALALRHFLRVHHSCRMVMAQSLHSATVVQTRRAELASQDLRQHAQHLDECLLRGDLA